MFFIGARTLALSVIRMQMEIEPRGAVLARHDGGNGPRLKAGDNACKDRLVWRHAKTRPIG